MREALATGSEGLPGCTTPHLKWVGHLYLMNRGYFLSVLVVDRLLGTCPAHGRDTWP